ncbi:MAG: FimB/Mfa2 family fimbrial subunit [Bacteroidales bacterium]|nr:FimB/Mfa2 family fimbrial subunit [Bacteroidales bacterium]
MKKIFCAALIALCVAACSKEEGAALPESGKKVTLTLNVSPYHVETKNTGLPNANSAQFDSIKLMEIFVFREDGVLEVYNKSYITDPGGVQTKHIKINMTPGKKYIYAVANAKISPWAGATTRSKFLAQEVLLKYENFGNVTLSAATEITITDHMTMEIYLKKLLARVRVRSISTSFANSPYRDMKLKNIKLYLTNVEGKKTYMGEEPATPLILNSGGYVAADNSSTAMANMMYEPISEEIGTNYYNKEHYLYCFENLLEEETATKKFTRLILEAELDNKKYYYPVDINQPGYGWDISMDHRGVKRNTSYDLRFVISGPGLDNPDDKLDQKTLTVQSYVSAWSSGGSFETTF